MLCTVNSGPLRALAVFALLAPAFLAPALNALQAPQALQAPRGRVSVGDLMALSTIVDVKIAPAGDRVAYVVSTPSVEKNLHETTFFVVATTGGAPQQLAGDVRLHTPALPAPRLRWTPDGTRVSFLALADGRPQVFVTPASGGASRAVTKAREGVVSFEWSADGKDIAYISRDAAERRPAIRVDAPAPVTRLWVQSGESDAKSITPDGHYVDSFSWHPDGKTLAYSASSITGFTAPYHTRIYTIRVDGGTPHALVDRAGMNTTPKFSPDGQLLAFITTNGRKELLAPRGLAIASLTDGGTSASAKATADKKAPPLPADSAPSNIRSYPMNGAWIGEMVWAADSRSLYVLMNEGTFATGEQMFEMPIVQVDVASGAATRWVEAGRVVDYSLSISRDGRTFAWREVEPRSMGDVVVRTTERTQKITTVNPQLQQLALGDLKPIKWQSFDGMEIWGLLLTPPGYTQGRIPTIVYCHGGPIGGVTYGIFPQFMHTVGQVDPYPVEALASAGYAVLFPMPRGGSGYGEAGHRAIINAWGEADFKDIMAGVDHLIAQGIADPDRLGVMGASYGGFMTNWIVTQTDRFKAASSSASISDLTDLFYLTDAGDVTAEYFKRPWENRESYVAHSPLTHAANVRTPLLLQHGENDPRVPLASGRKFYQALKGMGKTVEFDIFPRGGHVQYEPVAEHESMRRNIEWFTRWIRATPRK